MARRRGALVRAAVHAGQLLQPVPGGIGRYVTNLLDALPEVGVEATAFAAGPAPNERWRWVDLGRPRGSLRYELWHRFRRPQVRVEGDLVHATSLAVPPAGGRPLVVTVHDLVFLHQPEVLTPRGVAFHRRGLELARREAAAVIVPTAFGRDDLAGHGIDPDRIHVAPHGVTPAADRAAPAPWPEPYVLFVSTIEPRKGVADALDAHAELRRTHPDLRLVLAGQAGWGEPPDTDRPGVIAPGHLDDATLDAAYRHAVALVVPSRYEGFSLPVIEAMARGCPVITSDAACLPEVGGGVAVVVPTGDVAALGEAIDALLGDDARRAALGAAGRERAAAFTWRRSAEVHARAYEMAVASR